MNWLCAQGSVFPVMTSRGTIITVMNCWAWRPGRHLR